MYLYLVLYLYFCNELESDSTLGKPAVHFLRVSHFLFDRFRLQFSNDNTLFFNKSRACHTVTLSKCHVFRLSHCLCLIALWQNIAGLVVVLPMLTMVDGGGHPERKADNKEGESSLQQISVDRPMLI